MKLYYIITCICFSKSPKNLERNMEKKKSYVDRNIDEYLTEMYQIFRKSKVIVLSKAQIRIYKLTGKHLSTELLGSC